MEQQSNKPHRKKSETRGDGTKVKRAAGQNPKAFAPRSGRRLETTARRNAEKDQTRLHVPLPDRTFGSAGVAGQVSTNGETLGDGPPPVIVALIGPPGVGKSTLLRSLVRRYTKNTISDLKGPVTVVAGRNRRFTFVECPNDLGAMIDIAKVADLVLLLIDGSFGLEMETFEALSALSSHGLPKIMAVLTHLDLIKGTAALKAQKKRIKHRFWTEVYDGAKMFFLSGVMNGRYPDREILNLTRFIGVIKFRPLVFRNSHPYLLADRIEDVTPPDSLQSDPRCDRTVAFFGYLRGVPLRSPSPSNPVKVHVPGTGANAFAVTSVRALADPCPLPTDDSEKRRRLSDKHRVLYAPFSGGAGGAMSFDGETIWISTRGYFSRREQAGFENTVGEGEEMVLSLQASRRSLGHQAAETDFRLLDTSEAPLKADELEDAQGITNLDIPEEVGISSPQAGAFEEYSEQVDSDADPDLRLDEESVLERLSLPESQPDVPWKRRMTNITASLARDRPHHRSPSHLIYDRGLAPDQVCRSLDIRRLVSVSEDASSALYPHRSTIRRDSEFRPDQQRQLESIWDDLMASLSCAFTTSDSQWDLSREGATDTEAEDSGFEDLEVSDNAGGAESGKAEPTSANLGLAAKKRVLKEKFDREYDESSSENEEDFYARQKTEIERRLDLTRQEFAGDDESLRALVEGHRPGCYVRLELTRVPFEFMDHFDPVFPLLLGGLLPAEENVGFVQLKLKKHRWSPKVLKTNDPLIISAGWHRFQTLPVFSLNDASRNRMLKYTPDHTHCLATYYGPTFAPNTGICAMTRLDPASSQFRIAATGVVLDADGSAQIVKKLKLTGAPFKIFKHTAFVKDMFNTSLEVAKFEGAKLTTVSGIRGEIKKALAKPEGAFRATFEDKILMSDLIFMRAWHTVQPRPFYTPVASLLQAQKSGWKGMRLTGQVRREAGIPTVQKADSAYKPIERQARRFNALRIPRNLQAALPFASKPKLELPRKRKTYLQKRVVVLEPQERKALGLLQQAQALAKAKATKRRETKAARNAKIANRTNVHEGRSEHAKELRKQFFRQQAKQDTSGGTKRKRGA